jgi:hypothetical protein
VRFAVSVNTKLKSYLPFILATSLLFYPNSLAPFLGVSPPFIKLK